MKTYNRHTIREVDIALTYDDINIVPHASDIPSRSVVDTKARLVGDVWIKNPLIPANMDSITELQMMYAAAKAGGIAFLHRFMPVEKMVELLNVFYANGWYLGGVSVGAGTPGITRARHAIEAFQTHRRETTICPSDIKMVVMVDVAHGDHTQVCRTVASIKQMIQNCGLQDRVFIIAGNIATYAAAKRLIESGVHGLKVGMGNGSLCETRLRTGMGVPQVSAIAEVVRATEETDVTVCADGGLKYPGDIAKAIWLGADTVMSGYLFAGCDETPGTVMKKGVFPNETEVKIYRGSASYASKLDRGEKRNVEGNIKEVPCKGPASYVFDQVQQGVQSAFSYGGAVNADEFRAYNVAIRITSNGVLEAKPNFLDR